MDFNRAKISLLLSEVPLHWPSTLQSFLTGSSLEALGKIKHSAAHKININLSLPDSSLDIQLFCVKYLVTNFPFTILETSEIPKWPETVHTSLEADLAAFLEVHVRLQNGKIEVMLHRTTDEFP